MTITIRKRLLRVNAMFLGVFGLLGLAVLDIPAACCWLGAAGSIIRAAPQAAVGFIEAHGLAVIIGALFFHASWKVPDRSWHVAAVAIHLLLGTANVVFWDIFVVGNVVWLGWLATTLHFLFASLQTVAALSVNKGHVSSEREQAGVLPTR